MVKRTGGGHFGIQVDGADEDDDLMTVKRVNHGMDGDSDEEDRTPAPLRGGGKMALADGPADLGAALRARAKKGKLRIKDGGHGGNARVVFDEDGEAMEPLEALGARDAGPVPEGGAELAAAAKAHYDRVKAQRLAADKADRLREKQRLRDMRDKARAKARKAAGDDHSEDDDVGVQLGGASDLDDDEDADGKRRRGGDSSDSDSESGSGRAKRSRRTDVAVSGMALKDETVESMEERALRLLGA